MQKPYRYLRTSLRDLSWRYGLFYAALLLALIFSYQPVLTISIWYWLIVGILFVLEYWGSYFIITDTSLIQYSAFYRGREIPFEKIRLLGVGRSTVVILQPAGLMVTYETKSGGNESYVLTFDSHDTHEIIKFVTDISLAYPQLTVDEKLHEWIKKNTAKK